jgi:hypothetical protein
MRILAIVAACAALHAFAESPGDFASGATLTPTGPDALQRFALPFEAYRDGRRDLADVRVFNAKGEPVPIAVAAEPERTKEAPRTVVLPQFAVSTLAAPQGSRGGSEVTVRTSDGTLVQIRGRGAASGKTVVPAAYLLDASKLEEPLQALVFAWDAAPGTQVVRVTIEASEDLQAWRHVGSASLVRLESEGRVLEQPRATFSATKAKYYRVTWSPAAFTLRGVQGELEPVVKKAPRSILTLKAAKGEHPGEFVYDLGARLPIEAVRIVPGEGNSVATFAILARTGTGSEWTPVASSVFYRLVRDGNEVQSGPLEIAPHTAREWMARTDPQAGGVGGVAPRIEAQWRDAEVVFVARGDPPFRLAFGDPEAKSGWTPVSTLMPGYKRGDEMKLAEAKLGLVESGAVRGSNWPAWAAEMGPRKLTLWAILFAAVAVLGFMAWRLSRQMR